MFSKKLGRLRFAPLFIFWIIFGFYLSIFAYDWPTEPFTTSG